MLDDLVREHHVEAVLVERQLLGGRDDHEQAATLRLRSRGRVDFHPNDIRRELAELLGVHADTAARVEDAGALQLCPPAHQRQPPLLPRAPDVGRVAAQRRLIIGAPEICCLHVYPLAPLRR